MWREEVAEIATSIDPRYTQCEAMSVHYAQPILLIEFEEHKSFQLQVRMGSQAARGVNIKQHR